MKRLKILLIALLLPVLTANAEPTDIYQVEVVVFRYVNHATSLDSWQTPSYISTVNAIDLVLPEFSTDETSPNYCLLPVEKMNLNKEEERLQNNPEFEVLTHLAWTQPIADVWHTKPVHLNGGQNYSFAGELSNEVDGTITLSLGKFINLETDLYFTEPTSRLILDQQHNSRQFAQLPQIMSYHMTQKRRMKLDELNYIDNPNFGMLLKVSKVELPKVIETENAEAEATTTSTQTETAKDAA